MALLVTTPDPENYGIVALHQLMADFEMKNGKPPNRLRIGKKALDVLLEDIDVQGGVLHLVEGMTPIIAGTEWTFEVDSQS